MVTSGRISSTVTFVANKKQKEADDEIIRLLISVWSAVGYFWVLAVFSLTRLQCLSDSF
jgi:hypothetical protein